MKSCESLVGVYTHTDTSSKKLAIKSKALCMPKKGLKVQQI